jgi:hypothetical protein
MLFLMGEFSSWVAVERLAGVVGESVTLLSGIRKGWNLETIVFRDLVFIIP